MTAAFRRGLVVSAIFAFVAVSARAQAPASQANTTGDVVQQVKAAQQQMLQAALQNDRNTVSTFLDEDLTWVGSDGKVLSKSEVLAMLPPPVHDVDVQEVRPIGNKAIATGVAHIPNAPDVRFLQEWENRDGQWKLMAHEGSKAAPEMPAGTAGSGTAMTPMGTTGRHENPEVKARRTVAPTLSSDDARAVWRVQQKLLDAYLKGDANMYSKLTTDDYIRIEDGKQVDRSSFLDSVREHAKKKKGRIEMSDAQVAVNGDTAKVVWTTSGTQPGGTPLPPTRVTRIFEKKNGEWLQAAAIFTPIAEQ